MDPEQNSPLLPAFAHLNLGEVQFPNRNDRTGHIPLSSYLSLSARSPAGPLVLEVTLSNEQWDRVQTTLAQQGPVTTPAIADALRACRNGLQFQLSDRQQRALRVFAWDQICPELLAEKGAARLYGSVHALINHLWVKRSPAFLTSPLQIELRSASGKQMVGTLRTVDQYVAPLRDEVQRSPIAAPPWVKQKTWEQCRADAEAALNRFAEALRALEDGASFARAGPLVGIAAVTLQSWCVRGFPPLLHELRTLQLRPARDLTLSRLPRQESADWAHLLGAYQATTYWDGVPASVHFLSPHEAPVRAVHDAIRRAIPGLQVHLEQKVMKGNDRWVATVYSQSFSAALSRLTQGNSRLPWEILGSETEQLAYLRGYFAFAGSTYERGYLFFSTHHPEIVVGVAHLLDRRGVPVSIHEWKHVRGDIVHPYALRRMRDLSLLLPHEAERLKARIESPQAARSPIERYETVQRLFRQRPPLTNAHISREARMPTMTTYQWTVCGKVPREVTAQQELRRVAQLYEVPNVETVELLYRTHRMSAESAIEIGLRLTVPQVEAALRELASNGISGSQLSPPVLIRVGESYRADGLRKLGQ
jgi:hypothetical protein